LILDAMVASALAYRALQIGPRQGQVEDFLEFPTGWRFQSEFFGADSQDFGPQSGPVSFGIVLASQQSPGTLMIAIRGRVTHRGLWRPMVGPFRPALTGHRSAVPTDLMLEGRLAQTYASMQGSLMSLIEDQAPRSLILVGHSMGGALAMLLTLDVALCLQQQRCRTVICASPRPGNAAFSAFYQRVTLEAGIPTFHIVNPYDVIPRIPPRTVYGFAPPTAEVYPCPFKEAGLLPNPLVRHRVENYYRTLCRVFDREPGPGGMLATLDELIFL
jgi:predicted esterase